MASLAGFFCEYADALGWPGTFPVPEPEAEEFDIDMADEGRRKGTGDVPPGFGEDEMREEGC
jgi:hypothetical protein